MSKTPSYSGYKFYGWTTVKGSVGDRIYISSYNPYKMPAHDVVLYALYYCSDYDRGTYCKGKQSSQRTCDGTKDCMEVTSTHYGGSIVYYRCSVCGKTNYTNNGAGYKACYHSPCVHGNTSSHTYYDYTFPCEHNETAPHYYGGKACPHGNFSTHYR